MKHKILSISIIGIFLTMGILTSYAGSEEIKNINLDEDAFFVIMVRCEKTLLQRFSGESSSLYYPPDEFQTHIEITDLNTNEKTILTNEDMKTLDFDRENQYYRVEDYLEEGHDYNINCSIELSGNWAPTRDYLEENVYNIKFPDNLNLAFFTFQSILEIKSKSKTVNFLSMFIERFPIFQKLSRMF